MGEETVTISKRKYELMLVKIAFLDALDAAGVDNWEGFEFAHEIYEEEHGEEYWPY